MVCGLGGHPGLASAVLYIYIKSLHCETRTRPGTSSTQQEGIVLCISKCVVNLYACETRLITWRSRGLVPSFVLSPGGAGRFCYAALGFESPRALPPLIYLSMFAQTHMFATPQEGSLDLPKPYADAIGISKSAGIDPVLVSQRRSAGSCCVLRLTIFSSVQFGPKYL